MGRPLSRKFVFHWFLSSRWAPEKFELFIWDWFETVVILKNRSSLGVGLPIRLRDNWSSISNASHRITYVGLPFLKLNFHWFLNNQYGFERKRAYTLIRENSSPNPHTVLHPKSAATCFFRNAAFWLVGQNRHFLMARPFLSEVISSGVSNVRLNEGCLTNSFLLQQESTYHKNSALYWYSDRSRSRLENQILMFSVGDIVNLRSKNLNALKHKVPIFGFSKSKHVTAGGLNPDGIVLIPCFTLWVFIAPSIGRWRSILQSLPKSADKIQWKDRVRSFMWRGARNGDRQWLTDIGERRNDSTLDIEFIDWKPGNRSPYYSDNFKTIQQYCEHKYLIHQEGWSYSNRLKYLLLCGSPVIYANFNGWEEYWYHLLKHDYNVVVFENKGNEKSFKNLTYSLLKDDRRAQSIGNNGRALIQKYLSEQAIFCYLRNVLIKYAKLFTYKPKRHPNAIKIDEFLVGYSTWTQNQQYASVWLAASSVGDVKSPVKS